ncbi:MAG: flagellar biosynthetic protein FliO [Oscillospiraceae bacterium]|nr:flagellar biosynthetic protein FliO [Oscillospiraceae bacterium]
MLRAVIGVTEGAASGGGGFQSLFVGLLGFAALLALGYFGLRYLSRRGPAAARGRGLRVLDRMAVSRENMILIVRVAGRILTVGVTKEGMSTLCELTREEWETNRAEPSDSARTFDEDMPEESETLEEPEGILGFLRRFAHNLGVCAGVLPKGTPPARPPMSRPAPRAAAEAAEAGAFDACLRRAETEWAAAPEPRAKPRAAFRTEPRTEIRAETYAEPRVEPRVEVEPPAPEFRVDYNAAIERMKQCGRMERPAQRTPLGGWVPPAPFGTPPPPSASADAEEDHLAVVLNRMARRTDRLARMAAREDRRRAE